MRNIDGKALVNEAYRAALVTSLSIGSARLAKAVFKTSASSLDFVMRDLLMCTLYTGAGMIIKDTLVRQGTIPDDILK